MYHKKIYKTTVYLKFSYKYDILLIIKVEDCQIVMLIILSGGYYMEKNKVKINLCSQNLTIVSDESPEYINGLASEINNKIDLMLKVNRYRPTLSAILLCALQYCDDNHKLIEENEALKAQIKELSQKVRPRTQRENSPRVMDKNTRLEPKPRQQSLFEKK